MLCILPQLYVTRLLLQAFRVAPKVCDAEESELASCYMWLESVGELMFCEVDLGQGETEASW